MSALALWIVAFYFIFGYFVMLTVIHYEMGGLSIADLFAAVGYAFIWPALLAVLGILVVATQPDWFTRKRWFP